MTHRWLIRLAVAGVVLLATAVLGLVILISTTSAPELPPPPLPTVTPGPAANPDSQIHLLITSDPSGSVAQTDLSFEQTIDPGQTDSQCRFHGHWSLDVNPKQVIGHPYAVAPTEQEWEKASKAIATAYAICPTQIVLMWYGHDPSHPTSDVWTAGLPVSMASTIDGPTLRRYALRHEQQM